MKSLIRISITIFAVIFFYSCGTDTSVNNVIPPTSGTFTLSGTVENWTLGGNIRLIAQLYDTAFWGSTIVINTDTVSSSGAFSLIFNIPPDSFLFPMNFNPDTSCVSTVIVNPAGTKLSSTVGLGLFNDSTWAGSIFKSNYNSDTTIVAGQFQVFYLYLNQNVSINGSVICGFGDTTIYNISGTRGWNKVVALYSSYTHITVSTDEPAGGKWYAHTYILSGDNGDRSLRKRFFGFSNCNTCR